MAGRPAAPADTTSREDAVDGEEGAVAPDRIERDDRRPTDDRTPPDGMIVRGPTQRRRRRR